ncbi:MAG: magnesium chelatase domain-containing protein [Pirellulales bacterium]
MLDSPKLAPAELPKQAASFDLPITLGILAGSGQLASELLAATHQRLRRLAS